MAEPGAPRPEEIKISAQEVIEAYLNAKRVDNQAAYDQASALYEGWVIQEEGLVGPTADHQIEFEFRRTQIFISIGYKDVAQEALSELKYRIEQEGGPRRDEFIAKIREMEKELQ